MTTSRGRFPFGAPVQPCGAERPDEVDAFVLGAYPSALHVRWVPPQSTGLKPVAALAVDNEPSVFWDGACADDLVESWRAARFNSRWGSVSTARFNGPSGEWLEKNLLGPLRDAGFSSQFLTDFLSTYRLSVGAASRLHDTYDAMVANYPDLEPADLLAHPSESQIVAESLTEEASRLLAQIEAARPRLLVTLGNAASRVVARLAEIEGSSVLSPESYGGSRPVSMGGVRTTWIALVHPATPKSWEVRHQDWLANGGFAS